MAVQPNNAPSDKLTAEDVRHYIFDRTLEDNELEGDLTFSDDEINNAMRYTCLDFNSIPPYIKNASPQNPPPYMIYLDGIIKHLLTSKLHKLSRNDISYSAGGVQTNIDGRKIEHLKGLIRMHTESFIARSNEYKKIHNAYRAFGKVG